MRLSPRSLAFGAALLLAAGVARATFVGWVGIPLLSQGTEGTAVPNVIGQASSAAADTILEGVGLDLGTATARCSAATSGQVVDQNPSAGTVVAAGTFVDVSTSNGTPCKGKPPLWIYLETTR